MTVKERRKEPRYEIRINATIVTSEFSVSALASDISINGIGLICKKSIPPGTEVYVHLQLEKEFFLFGTVSWATESHDGDELACRLGVDIHAIIFPDIDAIEFQEKSKLFQEILSRIKNKRRVLDVA